MQGIVILGMYHSGTTYLAGRLHDKGIKMCDKGYFEGEVTGLHYEDAEVVEINRSELGRARLIDGMYQWNPSKDFRKRCLDYKLKRQADGVAWGFKEPRCALFSKVWLDVCRNCKVIVCHRSPIRVSYTRQTKYASEGSNPMNIQSAYSHTFARVLDNYRNLKGKQEPLFVFDFDANRKGHDRQNSALNKYLGFDFDYLEGWKFDT